jgi:hypothetical protein
MKEHPKDKLNTSAFQAGKVAQGCTFQITFTCSSYKSHNIPAKHWRADCNSIELRCLAKVQQAGAYAGKRQKSRRIRLIGV